MPLAMYSINQEEAEKMINHYKNRILDLEKTYGTGVRHGWVSSEIAHAAVWQNAWEEQLKELEDRDANSN